MKKYLLLAILSFLIILAFTYFRIAKYKAAFSQIMVNSGGIYQVEQFEDGFYFNLIDLLKHSTGSNIKPKLYHSNLKVSKFNFDLKFEEKFDFDCGSISYMPLPLQDSDIFITNEYLTVNSKPSFLFAKGNDRQYLNKLMFSDITILDTKNNVIGYFCIEYDKYSLGMIYLDKNKKDFDYYPDSLPVYTDCTLLDYFENSFLIYLYNRKMPYTRLADTEITEFKFFLGDSTNNKLNFFELPLDTENPLKMKPGLLGNNFVVYFNITQKDKFLYKIYDLKTAKFSEKFEVDAEDMKIFNGKFFFNKESKTIVSISDFIGRKANRKVFVYKLYDTSAKIIDEEYFFK